MEVMWYWSGRIGDDRFSRFFQGDVPPLWSEYEARGGIFHERCFEPSSTLLRNRSQHKVHPPYVNRTT